jgi:hypothetical protein
LDPDGEAQDPYNRVNWVDDDKVQELIPRIGSVLKSNPIVVDPAGWIIDGNHRAMAAVEAGLTSVPALVPAKQGVAEARTNPDKNIKRWAGKLDMAAFAENIKDKENWGVSMTVEPKLGINPRVGISEDTPKGIYFYPLEYFIHMVSRYTSLPWGDNMPYMQLFQYDRSGEMTRQTQVDPAQLKQALSQYCPKEIIQQVIDEPDSLYDRTPYWIIYDCLSRLGKSDETNIIRWNKVLRDLGFTSVFDPGRGWIATGEPTQGIILDPRIIKQHKTFVNRNPTILHRKYDINRLADAINWSDYYNSESQRQQVPYSHPDRQKTMLTVANNMLRPFLGKTSEEAKEMGLDQALKAASDKVIEILKQGAVQENFAEPGKENMDEGNQLTLRDFVVTISPHALSQAYNKGVDVHMVDDILRNISKVKDNIMSLEPGRALILHNGHGTGLGVRRGQGNNLTLATVFPTSPGFRKGKHPTFQVGTDSERQS